jgi:hypothetical protein
MMGVACPASGASDHTLAVTSPDGDTEVLHRFVNGTLSYTVGRADRTDGSTRWPELHAATADNTGGLVTVDTGGPPGSDGDETTGGERLSHSYRARFGTGPAPRSGSHRRGGFRGHVTAGFFRAQVP